MEGDTLISSSFRHLVNSPTFYLVCLSPEGYYSYVNPLFAQRFSFITDNFIGMHHDCSIFEEDIEKSHALIQKCLEHPHQIATAQLRKPDGKGGSVWSHWELSAELNLMGQVSELVCIGYDITETELAHRQAQEYARKIDTIIENITDGLLILDHQWRFTTLNAVAEKKIGISRADIIGKCFWDVYPDSDQFQYPAAYKKAMREGVSVMFQEYDPDKNQWFEVTAYPSEEGLTILFKDITDKKIADDLIWDSNYKLTAILNSTSDINILMDPEYRILSFNKVARESMRKFYDNRELAVGQNILDYILPGTEQDFISNFQSALSGKPVEVKIKLSFKPGLALWFLVKYFPVTDQNKKVIGVALNSTNIDKQQRQYEHLSEIASLYSHEIRRPVATILGITQLINGDKLTLENKEWFDYLTKTTKELDRVIHRIVRKTGEMG
jgi:PAS domain S-box-containing protein